MADQPTTTPAPEAPAEDASILTTAGQEKAEQRQEPPGLAAIDKKFSETFASEERMPDAPEPEPDEPGGEAEPTPEPEPATPTPAPEVDTPASAWDQLNPLQRHALERAKLSPDSMANVPLEALQETADNLHKSFNQISSEFAAVGRAQLEQPDTPTPDLTPEEQSRVQQVAPQAPQAPQPASATDILKEFGLPSADQVKEEYDEDMHDRFYKPMSRMAEVLAEVVNAQRQEQTQRQQEQTQQHQQSVLRQCDEFFQKQARSSDLCAKLYGTGQDWVIEPDQTEIRKQVMIQADHIHRGAAAKGVPMSIEDAMSRAQSIVLEPHIQEQAREEGAKLRQTQDNRTLHPPGSPRQPGKTRSAEEATGDAIDAIAAKHNIPGWNAY